MFLLAKYGTSLTIEVPVLKRDVADFAVGADWTPSAGDVKVSKDGGAAANITTLPTALTMGNTALWVVSLSATEMQAARIVVTIADSTTKAVEDQCVLVLTYGHASAHIELDFDAPRIPSDLTYLMGTALTQGAAGRLAGALSVFLDVATPALTVASANQTGDVFARVGAPTGASVSVDIATLLARITGAVPLASDYSPARAAKLDNLDAAVSTRSTYAGADTAGTTTLLSRLSSARAGYLDNLNVGGPVASSAEITAINQSASRRVLLATVQTWERPEAGTTTAWIESRTYDADGAAVNADSTPTFAVEGVVSGSLSGNLGAVTNPATGVYRVSYSVASNATVEQVRVDVSATLGGSAFQLSAFAQIADFVASTWTTADRSKLDAIYVDTQTLTSRITSTLFSGITRLGRWLGLLAGKTADASTLAEVQATTGGTSFSNTTDSLEAIRDRGDAAWLTGAGGGGSGSGAYTLTITVNDGVNPLQNVNVRLFEGVTPLNAPTNANGEAVFSVDAATWSVALTKPGYSFTPTTLVVVASDDVTYSMSPVVIVPDADPAKSTVTITCYGIDTLFEAGATVEVTQTGPPAGSKNAAFDSTPRTYTANGSGVVTLTLWRNATYKIRRGSSSSYLSFTPTDELNDVSSFLGSP